jgi:hypothetical protein
LTTTTEEDACDDDDDDEEKEVEQTLSARFMSFVCRVNATEAE